MVGCVRARRRTEKRSLHEETMVIVALYIATSALDEL
jgi:hypothetical protein